MELATTEIEWQMRAAHVGPYYQTQGRSNRKNRSSKQMCTIHQPVRHEKLVYDMTPAPAGVSPWNHQMLWQLYHRAIGDYDIQKKLDWYIVEKRGVFWIRKHKTNPQPVDKVFKSLDEAKAVVLLLIG